MTIPSWSEGAVAHTPAPTIGRRPASGPSGEKLKSANKSKGPGARWRHTSSQVRTDRLRDDPRGRGNRTRKGNVDLGARSERCRNIRRARGGDFSQQKGMPHDRRDGHDPQDVSRRITHDKGVARVRRRLPPTKLSAIVAAVNFRTWITSHIVNSSQERPAGPAGQSGRPIPTVEQSCYQDARGTVQDETGENADSLPFLRTYCAQI